MRILITSVTVAVGVAAPLAAQSSGPCAGEVFHLPARLAGTWQEFTVTPDGERLEGELQSMFEAGGCAFAQQFRSRDGSFTFRSLGYVDGESGRWREHFVLSNGRTAVYEWVADGPDIVLNRLQPAGPDLFRLRVTQIRTNSYEVIEERSRDGGATWARGERTITRRIAS